MDFPAAFATATAALDIARGLRAVEKSYDAVELKIQIVDLIDNLIDVKGALQDAREEVERLELAIAELRRASAVRAETVIYDGFRYERMPGTDDDPRGYPYCQRCDDQEGRLVRTVDASHGPGTTCPQCKTLFKQAYPFNWNPPAAT